MGRKEIADTHFRFAHRTSRGVLAPASKVPQLAIPITQNRVTQPIIPIGQRKVTYSTRRTQRPGELRADPFRPHRIAFPKVADVRAGPITQNHADIRCAP